MQTFHKNDFKSATGRQPIDVYMGRQIFISRVICQGLDKGTWLHWSHPKDEDQKERLKCGYCVSAKQSLKDALHQVHQLIEASIELEMSGDARFNFQPDPYKPSRYTESRLADYGSELKAVPA